MLNSVVLVDDNKATNFIHTKFLKESEAVKKVQAFQAGSEALAFLDAAKELPELIFLDINMPTMDAWEFLEEYRTLKTNVGAKIILLTTTISPEDERKLKNYPEVEQMLYKPLNIETITKVIHEHF